METSQYYNLNLPSRDGNDTADINEISENFREIDRVLGEEIPQNYVDNPKFDAHLAEKQDLFASVGADGDDIDLILNRATAFKLNGITRVRISENETMIANGVLSGDMDAVGNRIKEIAPPQSLTDAANKQYVDESIDAAKPKWKTLSSGTLDESTGGVAKITAELNGSIEDINEFRFYLEIPTGSPTVTGTTMYVNAVIDNPNPALKNCLFAVSHSGTPSVGKTTRTIAIMDVVTSPDGTRYIQSVANQLTINYGINTRVNPLSTLCLWDVSKSSKNLTINISNYNFESGTKWILEGR